MKRGLAPDMSNIPAGFPRSSECGPIEAQLASFNPTAAKAFPRSSECGPIEAAPATVNGVLALVFRAHQSAAPLKHDLEGVLWVHGEEFSALIRVRPH